MLLRKQGFSLGEIGLSSLLALPWALKFLWAPLVDRYGRRASAAAGLDRAAAARAVASWRRSRCRRSSALDRRCCMGAVLAARTCWPPRRTSPPTAWRSTCCARRARPRQRPAGRRLPRRHDHRRRRAARACTSGSARRGTFLAMAALTAARHAADRCSRASRRTPRRDRDERPPARSTALHFLRRPGAVRMLLAASSSTRRATRSRPACCARSSPTPASASPTSAGCSARSASSPGLLGALPAARWSTGSAAGTRCSRSALLQAAAVAGLRATWRCGSPSLRVAATRCAPPSTSPAAWPPPRSSPA